MSSSVALLSIHPEYVEAIRKGEKKVEFRKAGFSRRITHVVVYATSPIQRVIGYFSIKKIDQAAPSTLWERHKKAAGVSRSVYRKYFFNHKTAFGIEIKKFYALRSSIPLYKLGSITHPPQSFRYIDAKMFSTIEKQKLR